MQRSLGGRMKAARSRWTTHGVRWQVRRLMRVRRSRIRPFPCAKPREGKSHSTLKARGERQAAAASSELRGGFFLSASRR